jgi:Lar family restriction alleviation protein
MREILPCPFCGYAIQRDYDNPNDHQIAAIGYLHGYHVNCPCCDANGPFEYTIDEAIARWNERVNYE